jgi:AraC-like DNA-binding protein
MKKVALIINENIMDFEFDVGSLQEKTGMSRVHLYRKLKALTGLSPSMMIRNYRMKRAAILISQKAGSLLEIALMVGFSNPSHFAKCFRDFYGVSPRDFTNKHVEKS